MNYFAQFQAQMRQFSANLRAQVRRATANIPQGESGVWVNGRKVNALPSFPIGTETTVNNGHVVTRTVSLADSIAGFRSEGGVTVFQFGNSSTTPEALLARGH